MLLGEIFSKGKEGYANQTAIIFHEKRLTYGEIDSLINKLANGLKGLGLQKGDKVGLMMVNSPEFVISYFAITRAGGIVVPVNIMLKAEEMAYILGDSRAKFLITMPMFKKLVDVVVPRLPDLDTVIIAGETEKDEGIASFAELICRSSDEPAQVEASEDEVIVYLYTSGTTGRPKGAMLTHKNLIENTKSCAEVLTLRDTDIFLCVLPMFHSFAWTTSVLLPLFGGGKTVILENFAPQTVVNSLINEKVTVFCGVPTMYAVINQMPPVEFPDLRLAVSGGSAIPVALLKQLRERFNIPLIEGYGLSEASPVVTLNPVDGKQKPGSIGVPLPRVEVKIVDETGNEVPSNEPGELIVHGPNVMAGYFNRPEATAEALRDGWLYTGDIAKRDEEGYIYIVDRKKDLIINSGLNVYPREIEEVLHANPKIAEAAVVGVADELRGETIKAFIALKKGESMTEKEVIKYCREHLANYKIPKFVEFIDELPKSSTGKVLKRELKG